MKKRFISAILAALLTLSLCVSGYAAEAKFSDIKDHWAEETITSFASYGIIYGYPDGTVRPDDTISRGEFVALTARVFDCKDADISAPFDDLADCWAGPEIAALVSAGIVRADEYSGSFAPGAFITRMEMTRILVRAIDGGKGCTDDDSYTKAAMECGVLKGYPNGTLGMENTATRAEVFTMLVRSQEAKAEYDKKAEEKNTQPSGGGGYYVAPVPAAEISFTMPETAYVGESAVVSATVTGAVSVAWKLTVNDKETELPEDFVEIGGEISFAEVGTYTLTGAAKNSAGRETACTRTVTVYPVAALALELPTIAHTDKAVSASLSGELHGMPAAWTLVKNGESVEIADAIEGDFTDAGGSIRFTVKGVYRLTATVTDALGREFSANAEIVVYPVGEIGCFIPEVFHTDDTVSVVTAFENYDGGAVSWELERDGKVVDCMTGSLTADGGDICITEKGDYSLTASYTDGGGREYRHSQSFRVYPVPELSYSMEKTAHTDTEISVVTTGTNLDGLTVEWLLENSLGIQNWDTYVDGTLDSDGGSIHFKHAGTYSFVARVTDATCRVFLLENGAKCVVQPVLDLSFDLPATLHTDTTAEVRTFGNNNILPIKWTLARNGNSVPVSEYISGDLNAYGGSIRFTSDGEYTLTSTTTDVLGRSFTASADTTVLPLVTVTVIAPTQAHIGTPFEITTAIENLGVSDVKWTLSKNGENTEIDGSLGNSGGTITIIELGSYVLTASVTDAAGREYFESTVIEICNTAPNMPSLAVQPTRTVSGGKFLVNVSADATDPDSDAVTYEYSNISADGYYAVGQHTIKVRAVDSFGAVSEWVSKTFTVANSAPTTPVITRTPDGNCVTPGTAVSINASSTDPDGDAVTYVWENRPSASYVYGLGRQVVRVKAVDSTGAESPWAAIIFFVASNSNGGGMTLTGPESTIMENGIAGATITSFTFTVPPVSGHNGSDYGRVRGYNKNTGAWDQLAYQTTNNGVTLTNAMSHGVYTQLEFYYYTNHNCMYNKSNITYSVEFHFE